MSEVEMLPLSFIAIFFGSWTKVSKNDQLSLFDCRNVHLHYHFIFYHRFYKFKEFEASSMYKVYCCKLWEPACSLLIVGRSFDEISPSEGEPVVSCGAIYVIAYEAILVFLPSAVKRTQQGIEGASKASKRTGDACLVSLRIIPQV
jgi:hypothetical protein